MKIKEREFVEITLEKLHKQKSYEWKTGVEKLGLIKSEVLPIERLFETYISYEKFDFLGHLRQVSIYFRDAIRLPEDAFAWAKLYKEKYGFNLADNAVSAKPCAIDDVEDLKYEYVWERKRKHKGSFPDPALYNIFGYSSYISFQQKMMIHTLKKMRLGSTLLACLPTGSGKSLLWQYAVATGKFAGTTIVIVPTNALATDHVKNDQDTLKNLPWVQSVNYSSETFGGSEEKMEWLCKRIKDQEQLILYISPEGLTNSTIKKAILEAANQQAISGIVIDEAHLVVDWGMKFRPEFQFIPGLLRQVKERSKNSVYTVLLSATYTENDKEVLLKIFGDEVVYEYRGDELRPELSYYRHHCKHENERKKLLLQLLATVPKPAIVYVGTVRNSEIYERWIKEEGQFSRVARFNGETNETQREELISQWRENKIDIMVATSAFGMGVDKPDVRTVITAYTPENISRYYQEVGRAGRDGYSALNFVLFCPSVDTGLVRHNVDKQVIGTENLWKRWKALKDSAEVGKSDDERDCYILDTDAKHEELTYEITGGYNSGWNDNVISMLARAGYIEIVDVWRKGTVNHHKAYYVKVRVKNFDICFNEEQYRKKIEQFREMERNEIVAGKELVNQLLSSDDWGCYANIFQFVFGYVERLCSGCPICRKNDIPEYKEKSKAFLMTNAQLELKKTFQFRNFASVCTDSKSTTLIGYDQELSEEGRSLLIRKLLVAEANIFVFETCQDMDLSTFELFENNEVLFLSIDELEELPDFFIAGTVIYFLSNNESVNKRMLKYSKRCIKRKKDINQIYVGKLDYEDQEEKRPLISCVEEVKLVNTILEEDTIW